MKQERYQRFMEVQAQISADRLQQKIGTVQQVIVDSISDVGAIARTYSDAPDIDGNVIIPDEFDLKPGEWVDVLIEDADDYDLWGTVVEVEE